MKFRISALTVNRMFILSTNDGENVKHLAMSGCLLYHVGITLLNILICFKIWMSAVAEFLGNAVCLQVVELRIATTARLRVANINRYEVSILCSY